MIDIVTVLFDGTDLGLPSYSARAGYNAVWADKLFRGIKRNYSGDFRFICLVDKDYNFSENIEAIRFDEKAPGWGCIMEAFRPDLGENKRIILGLDTVITGNLDEIFNFDRGIGLPSDPYSSNTICNAVGIFSIEWTRKIWKLWGQRQGYDAPHLLYGGRVSEMAFLRHFAGGAIRLDHIFEDKIQSYKVHWTANDDEKRSKARIVYFHGIPKPPSIDAKILEHWV